MCIWVYVYMCICVNVYMCICVNVYMCICVYAQMRICVYAVCRRFWWHVGSSWISQWIQRILWCFLSKWAVFRAPVFTFLLPGTDHLHHTGITLFPSKITWLWTKHGISNRHKIWYSCNQEDHSELGFIMAYGNISWWWLVSSTATTDPRLPRLSHIFQGSFEQLVGDPQLLNPRGLGDMLRGARMSWHGTRYAYK